MNGTGGWQKRSVAEVMSTLGSDSEKGLDNGKVSANRRKWGGNDLWYTGSAFMFFRPESGFSVLGYVIMAITAFSAAAFDKCKDSVLIGILLLCGIAVSAACYVFAGTACKRHSEKWIPLCTVIRNGKPCRIRADMLVLGDVIIFEKGDRIHADIKLIQSEDITVREPVFIKRKGPVKKSAVGNALAAEGQALPEDFIYAGAYILSGAGKGVVCAVGDNTLQGKNGRINLTQAKDTARLASLRKRGVSAGAVALMFAFIAIMVGVFIPFAADFITLFIIFLAFAVSAGGETVPALCCLAYFIAIIKTEDSGFFIRDTAGVDYFIDCNGICVENSSLMKFDKTELKSVWASGGDLELGDGAADELFSLMLAGTNYGEGKYGSETLLAVNAHMADRGDADKYISATVNTKPVLDHKIVGATHYSLFASGNEQYFAVTGSIEDVISKCTKIRVNGSDRPISRGDISNILSSASEALRVASSIIAVGVRVSPYNNIKRLSVLTSELSFVGFIAMETPAHPTLPTGLAYLRQCKVPFVLCTDGSGEDINFARKLGINKGRGELVSTDPESASVELFSERSNGGALYISDSEYLTDFLASVKKSGKRLVFVGSDKYAGFGGLSVTTAEAVPFSGAYVNVNKGAEVSGVIDSFRILRSLFGRLRAVYKFLFVSAVIRAIYCLTVIFGVSFVFPSLVLGWGLVLDAAISAAILLLNLKK